MTVCDCNCHQMVNEPSNCGNCGNTGIKYDDTVTLDNRIILKPLLQKPIYPVGTKVLPVNVDTVGSLTGVI